MFSSRRSGHPKNLTSLFRKIKTKIEGEPPIRTKLSDDVFLNYVCWDTPNRGNQRGWKSHRKTQYK